MERTCPHDVEHHDPDDPCSCRWVLDNPGVASL